MFFSYQIEADPLPENYVLRHDVGLHLALHFDVENLQSLLSLERNHLRGRIHDGRIGRNGPTNGVGRVCHIDDDHLIGLANFFADTNELVRFHGEAVEAHIGGADTDISELAKKG